MIDDLQPPEDVRSGAAVAACPATENGKTLSELTEQLEAAFEAGDYAFVGQRINDDLLSAWYGLRLERLQEMLRTLVNHAESRTPFIGSLSIFLHQYGKSETEMRMLLRAVSRENSTRATVIRVLASLEPRIHGRPVEALNRAVRVRQESGAMQMVFAADDGWPLMASVQLGTTAMLAGEFTQALHFFAEAQLQAHPLRLSFLLRDALVRSALVHAVVGDRAEARRLLARSDGVTRTQSWAEETIDASGAIVVSLVCDEPVLERLERLREVDPRAVGEMWPFYLVAMHRLLLEVDARDEAGGLLHTYEAMPLPRVEGQGFSGSVLQLLRANLALANRRPVEAENALRSADAGLRVTRIIDAHVQLQRGRHARAIGLANGARTTGRMTQLELWRLAVIANGCHALGDAAAAREALEQIDDLRMPLRVPEAQLIHPDLWKIGAEVIAGWPKDGLAAELPLMQPQLTDGEVAVLRELAQGSSRLEIASALYISINTVKTQLRTAYRKLGVNSADAAVRKAERLGYL